MMQNLFETDFVSLFHAGTFVHIGLLFYAIGFIVRDELWLRGYVLAGSGFYLLYYFHYPVTPLWDAIIASTIISAINIVLIVIIIRERTKFAMNAEEIGLFNSFSTLNPGQFRKLMQLGTWKTAPSDTVLTDPEANLDSLFYVVSGTLRATKGPHEFELLGGKFIGEIAFLTNETPSAKVIAPAGASYIEWKVADIRRLCKRNVGFENALIALFNFDLARKVAKAIRP